MRKHSVELISALLLALVCSRQVHFAASSEQDFDDDEGVAINSEEAQETASSDDSEDIVYESPTYDPSKFYFVDHFDNIEESPKKWVKSEAKKDDTAEEIAKYDGVWEFESPQRIVWKNDIGLVLKSKAKHAAISSRLTKPFEFVDKPLIVQYEVTMQDGQTCGGSYIKLLSAGKRNEDLTKFNDKTPYTIMFGPDKCGNDIKLHFIFRHVNPINGTISEKHARKPRERLEEPFTDKLPHLYQLVVKPDNTFEIRVDHRVVNEGSLLNDFTPAVNPPKEIDDPNDKKPDDWDEREKIPDPDASKPEDWDENAPPQIPDPNAVKPDGWLDDEPDMIPDYNAEKPADWDAEIDGEWEAPLVDNPICEKVSGCGQWKAPLITNKAYKGKWRAPLIENPNYKGKWAARKIPNPDFFEDLEPFLMTPIDAIGIELWSMSSDILFDNLIITDDIGVADEFAAITFDLKRKYIDKESESFVNKVLNYLSENPWMWSIAILAIGVPLSYSIYRLCSSEENSEEAKKTDAVQEDHQPEVENISRDEVESKEDNDEEVSSTPNVMKKSDSDEKSDKSVDDENDDTEIEDAVDDEDEEDEDEEQQQHQPTESVESASKETETSTATSNVRKRKPRVRKDQC